AILAALVGFQKSSLAEKMGPPLTICFIAAAVVLVVASVFALFRKDKIVIKKHKLIIVHKFMLFSRKKQEISKYEIEAVYANLNPATGRYFLTISGFNKTLVFGKKLPVESLKWVRDFLTYEITK
ncbi:MAG: hypothetical protein LBL47_01575, partial [Lactobacillus sp.]|nr:hypothetical protein [Lactobacillus sp.]